MSPTGEPEGREAAGGVDANFSGCVEQEHLMKTAVRGTGFHEELAIVEGKVHGVSISGSGRALWQGHLPVCPRTKAFGEHLFGIGDGQVQRIRGFGEILCYGERLLSKGGYVRHVT
jgi:hypothetical protein